MTHGESSGVWSTFATSQSGLGTVAWHQDLTWDLLTAVLVLFHFYLLRGLLRWPSTKACPKQPELVKRELTQEEAFCKKVLTCQGLQDAEGSASAFREVGQDVGGYSQAPALLLKTFKMSECTGSIAWELYKDTKDRVEYSRVLYHAVISILLKSQNVDYAMDVLRDMTLQDVLPDSYAYSSIIRAHLARGDLESSMQLLGQMQRQEISPDFSTFQAVLEACAHRQLLVLAEEVLRSMECCNVAPASCTLATMIRLYGRNGDLGAALQTFREMPKKFGFSADSHAFTCLISVCAAEGEIAEAFQVYEQMSAVGYQADATCFKALLSGSLQQGDLDTAARLISDAQAQGLGLTRDSLELFLLQSVRRGRHELAVPVLEEAITRKDPPLAWP
ncbi:Pentatricopeptide repeat-containing protein At1g05670 [Durusdinium trenchii]|uniref:Mitochondrial n=1 Tax=Durusdinium trenchii TaxID=1381693 RepID=A0ABP0Q3B2_9DINO